MLVESIMYLANETIIYQHKKLTILITEVHNSDFHLLLLSIYCFQAGEFF